MKLNREDWAVGTAIDPMLSSLAGFYKEKWMKKYILLLLCLPSAGSAICLESNCRVIVNNHQYQPPSYQQPSTYATERLLNELKSNARDRDLLNKLETLRDKPTKTYPW